MMSRVLHENGNYEVRITGSQALQENNRDTGPGYKAINKRTGIVEFTHMQLPHIIWTVDQMDKALTDLQDPVTELAAPASIN